MNARTEPSVGLTLQAEIPSADRFDLLCAFIKWSGLRLLQPVLSAYLQAGGELRVLSTVYLGATDRRTRLHAKAWLFHRRSGSSTDYIGSSKLSGAALLDGLEWNVRLAALESAGAAPLVEMLRSCHAGGRSHAPCGSVWEDMASEQP